MIDLGTCLGSCKSTTIPSPLADQMTLASMKFYYNMLDSNSNISHLVTDSEEYGRYFIPIIILCY